MHLSIITLRIYNTIARRSMQPHPRCLPAGSSASALTLPVPVPRHHQRLTVTPLFAGIPSASISISVGECGRLRAKRKDNIWSVDNDLAEREALQRQRRKKRNSNAAVRRRGKGRRGRGRDDSAPVLVSGPMLVEVERVLQTQEPVIKPAWDTFTSSISGIWKGVGAVFSPFTAEMEPISVNNKRENLYDCYTLSHIERISSANEVKRTVNWVTLNPYGEGIGDGKDKEASGLPAYESFDLNKSELLEEDSMIMEPGLIFFEEGSYSRGPVELPVGEYDESKYFYSPTFKFEQCLVKGSHRRLRIVHTIEFSEGGKSIQIIRVAVYEEQWVSPSHLNFADEGTFDLKPFSQRKRTGPSELAGSWKVFEVSATPIHTDSATEDPSTTSIGPSFVYFCTESVKKRTLPDSSFEEQELLDMQDVTILWLPGGVTAYVDVDMEGVLCIGVGWYSNEGINLVMERDYGTDGKLREVRWKSEVKRRWNNSPLPM